ncbi:MAG: hypothetical protein MPN21_17925 [Thermoanaerobaculia bacterium]|nr:hypothetical protein [Thermoanaerobaculia bacterium]
MNQHDDVPPESPAGPPFDRSEDHAYFRAIESLFIELRGAPFQLSPDDFKVAKSWRAKGVPLDVALATLREKVTGAIERGQDPKRRLSYYRQAVEQAWRRQSELQAPGSITTAQDLELAPRLARLAARLPDSLPEIRARVEALRNENGGAEKVDTTLAEIDRDMLELARQALSAAERERLARQLRESMAALGGRLGGVSNSARDRAEIRLLRDLANLPFLSLFSPDALEDGGT